VAEELNATVAPSREEALSADLVATVTPGQEIVLAEGALRPGQHASLMGADGPGKAEIAVAELAHAHVFADDWEQASHNGDLVHAVEAGAIARADVTELGAVLAGTAAGRRSDDDITVFDSTGLAIQDLAIALAALERTDELDLPQVPL
jgi:ornithine cyclodeaminase/alanine dehydrogenase-like protein (mu-crystallin family)